MSFGGFKIISLISMYVLSNNDLKTMILII